MGSLDGPLRDIVVDYIGDLIAQDILDCLPTNRQAACLPSGDSRPTSILIFQERLLPKRITRPECKWTLALDENVDTTVYNHIEGIGVIELLEDDLALGVLEADHGVGDGVLLLLS